MVNGRDLSERQVPTCQDSSATPTALQAPEHVRTNLSDLGRALAQSARENFVALVLYGELARGSYRGDKTGITVAIVLRDASAAALATIAPILRAAQRSMRLEPLLLTEAEVGAACDVFVTSLLDIQAHNVLIAGRDVFGSLVFKREHLRLRVEHELRDLAIRLRQRWVMAFDQPEALAARLIHTMPPLAMELRWLLQLAGKSTGTEDAREIFSSAAATFDLDGSALVRATSLKVHEQAGEDMGELYSRVLASVARAATIVDGMK